MADPATDAAPTEGAATPYPDRAYAWYVTVLLMLAYMVSFLDRQVFSTLMEAIKADLGVSDGTMGLLAGLAFALFYSILGIPLGMVADRKNRRNLIVAGITLWCLMTAACGLAKTTVQLFLARTGVGVGEATLGPSALSMISDYFPPEKRAMPIAVYNMGISLGAGLAMIGSGLVVGWVMTLGDVSLPLVGALAGWHLVFIMIGLPGLVIAALMMLTVREPARRGRMAGGETLPLSTISKFLRARVKTFGTLMFGMSVVTIIGYMFFAWLIPMFMRKFGWSAPEAAIHYGWVNLICGPIGVITAGWTANRLAARGDKSGSLRVAFVCCAITVPAATLVGLMPTPALATLMLVPLSLGAAGATATGAASVIAIVPNELRGQTAAVYLFVLSFMGGIIGPWSVGALNDQISDLGLSLTICSGIGGTFALVLLFRAFPYYGKAVEEAATWTEAP